MRPLPSSICEELENWKLDRVIGSTKNNKILLHLSQADDLRSVKIDLEIEAIISDEIGTVFMPSVLFLGYKLHLFGYKI